MPLLPPEPPMIKTIEQLADTLEKLGQISYCRGSFFSTANRAVCEAMSAGAFKRPPFTTLQDRLVVPNIIAMQELVNWLKEQGENPLKAFDDQHGKQVAILDDQQGKRIAAALRRLNVSTLSESQQAAWDYIHKHPGAMGVEIALAVGVEEITLRNHIMPVLKAHGVFNVSQQGYFLPGYVPPAPSTPKTRKRG